MQELPSWMVHPAPGTAAFFGNGRLKITLIAVACMILGYYVTSSFQPLDGDDAFGFESGYDVASTGVLEGPNVYPGSYQPHANSPNGDSTADDKSTRRPIKKPSIKGALSDLHHAVSDKVALWKPWSPELEEANATSTQEAPPVANATSKPLKSEEVLTPETDGFGRKTRVGKCTIVLYGSSIYERTVQTHSTHDRLHGYPLYVLRIPILDDVWSKPAYILSILLRELAKPQEDRLEWLLWVDADTIMLNPYIPLEIFLPPSPQFDDIHLLVTHDWNGLNNGVFPVRVNQWAVDLFSAIVAFRYYRPDEPLTFRDQSAMDTLLHEKKFADHTVEAPQRWFNAYQGEHNETLAPYQVRRGDFLVHFAGVINRDERILFWLDRAEQHLPDWEMEVQHTSYPAEIKDFWAQKAGERKDREVAMAEARRKATELLTQTDSKMAEYQDRLTPIDVGVIQERQAALRRVLETDASNLDLATVTSAMDSLSQILSPLTTAIDSAHKLLMKEAHEEIFQSEKSLLSRPEEVSISETSEVEEKAATLKNLVVAPEWSKKELGDAIEALRMARAGFEARVRELEVERGKLVEAERLAGAQG